MNADEKVKALSDEALLQTVSRLSAKENEATVELLFHLGEVEKRRAYVPAGYSSMFNYCTWKLRYSEPAANRRIACARALMQFPELAGDLLSREISLTTLSLVCGILNRENQSEVTAAIRGKSRRQVEEFIAGFRPRAREPRERVKPLMVAVPRKEEPSWGSLFEAREKQPTAGNSSMTSTAARECDGFSKAGHGCPEVTTASAGSAPAAETVPGTEAVPAVSAAVVSAPDVVRRGNMAPAAPAFEQRFELKFTIGADTRKKLDQAKLLLSGKHPRGVRIEDVFEEALEALLEKRSPERRRARRARREMEAAAKSRAGQAESQAKRVKCSRTESDAGARTSRPKRGVPESAVGALPSRHIPCALRDQLYVRDGGRCTFVSPAGVRCGERHNLQLHHLEPFGKGGAHAAGNLTLHCAIHNTHQAVREYGSEHMQRCRSGHSAS